MKKIFIIATLLATFLVSCKKENNVTAESTAPERVSLSVGLANQELSLETKATISETNEKTIKSLQVLVFNSDGKLDAYGKGTSASLTLSTTTGQKDIYAVVNGENLSSVTTKAAFLATKSLLTNNTLSTASATDGLEMIGSVSQNITAASNVSITVNRLVARLSINGVKTRFSAPAYANATFKVKKAYLVNCAGDINFGKTAAPTLWLNKMANSGTEAPELTYHAYSTPVSVTNNTAPVSTPDLNFYTYQNNTNTDVSGGTWSARKTRIVIEAELAGEIVYYPITISNIEPNKTYTVTELTITRRGSSNPDIPVVSYDCTYNVVVGDWTSAFSGPETV